MAITLKAHNGYNTRFAPAGAKKAYVARITGRDSKMTFAREFLCGEGEVLVDDPGLYEMRDTDKRGNPDDTYRVVMEYDGNLVRSTPISRGDAMTIARALESRSIDACVELTPRPGKQDPTVTVYDAAPITAKKAETKAVAASIDAATDECWRILSALAEKDAKKVLTALKARVSPKVPTTAQPLTPETPSGIVNDYAQDSGASQIAVGMDATPVAN